VHFDLTVSLGQVVTLVTLIGMGWRIDRVLSRFLIEHEMMLQDYCIRMGIDIDKLPTRVRR
jgi:hypothetical protein